MYFYQWSERKLRGNIFLCVCDWNEKLKGWLLPFFPFLLCISTQSERERISLEGKIYILVGGIKSFLFRYVYGTRIIIMG